jgi:hypothetical protein
MPQSGISGSAFSPSTVPASSCLQSFIHTMSFCLCLVKSTLRHTFTQSMPSLCSTCPNHLSHPRFTVSEAHLIPNSLSTFHWPLSFSMTPHCHPFGSLKVFFVFYFQEQSLSTINHTPCTYSIDLSFDAIKPHHQPSYSATN